MMAGIANTDVQSTWKQYLRRTPATTTISYILHPREPAKLERWSRNS